MAFGHFGSCPTTRPAERVQQVQSGWRAVLGAWAVGWALRMAPATGPAPGAGTWMAAATDFATTRAPAGPGERRGDHEEVADDVVANVEAAKNGSAFAFALLYDAYVDQVYAYIHRRVGHTQTAEDLTSDVFMRALKRIDSFTWQGKDFGAWLITIARNRTHDHFKSARTRLESTVEEVRDDRHAPPAADAPERQAELGAVREALADGLDQLKAEQAEVLRLRFLDGYDVAETARIMGKNDQSIRALQYRALKALAKHVDAEELVRS